MKGKLFGIGVGPGDPELLTFKAVGVMQKCDVIAVPKADGREETALNIVRQYLDGKALLRCSFAMDKDMEKRREVRQIAAEQIIKHLAAGQNVGFITLGDPTIYSTYMYVHEIVVSKGFCAEIVPGITSYTAAAAALGMALCEGDEALTIIPAGHSGNIDRLLDYPGNKVIMKSGENLNRVLAGLKERGYADSTRIACCASMREERLYYSIEEYEKTNEAGYFTIAIVKERIN